MVTHTTNVQTTAAARSRQPISMVVVLSTVAHPRWAVVNAAQPAHLERLPVVVMVSLHLHSCPVLSLCAVLDPTAAVYSQVVHDFHTQKPLYVVLDKSLTCLDNDGSPLLKKYHLEVDTPRFGVYRRPA